MTRLDVVYEWKLIWTFQKWLYNLNMNPIATKGSAVAWWLMPRTPDLEVGVSSPTRVKPWCVLEQGTFTPQKVLVIPRKRWLRPNMTEKLFTGMLRINHPTNHSYQTKCEKRFSNTTSQCNRSCTKDCVNRK